MTASCGLSWAGLKGDSRKVMRDVHWAMGPRRNRALCHKRCQHTGRHKVWCAVCKPSMKRDRAHNVRGSSPWPNPAQCTAFFLAWI